ncbi:protein MAIN-LIKE 1-like [Arachis duranensis]|uniref:Protein MAIN-LIKE 1-like n=1 Tax=Arachis duranensis TaxID=130453 RepID=A0A6P4E097_ARADU|nr:protein MAIN-LIKE 1-like [Arachis duranensis]
MAITLQDVAYQLGLRIDGDPVSGCIGGWEQYYQRRTIEEFCEQLLGVVLDPDDRQSQTRRTVKLTWFQNIVCGEFEQDATEERLMRYKRGYIMQLIGGMLFSDASDSRVHIRWLPLLEDLETCGRLSCGSAVLAWLYRQMCRATEHDQRNLGRWVQDRPDNDRGEGRLRRYKRTLNGIGMLNVEWTPYADPQLIGLAPSTIAEAEASSVVVCPLLCFVIVEWHQVDRAVRHFGGLQHIPTRPLNIDDMHRLDGRFGRVEWFTHLLGGWHELCDARVHHHLPIHHYIDLCPSLPYMTWYIQWAHTELVGLGEQHLVAAGVVPHDLPTHHPLAPDLH